MSSFNPIHVSPPLKKLAVEAKTGTTPSSSLSQARGRISWLSQLHAPQLDRVHHALPAGRADAIAEQIRALPYADPVMALTIARSRLRHLNQHYLVHSRRADITAWFHTAFSRLAETPTQPVAMGGDSLYACKGDGGLIGFCEELAIAYKLCLIDAEPHGASTQEYANYLYLALFFHVQAMLQRYALHIRQPSHTWREAHLLYAAAEDRRLHRATCRYRLTGAMPDIHDQYVQLLLVAGANPYSLSQTDTRWVIGFTTRMASISRMVHPDNLDVVTAALGVRLDSDEGPLRLRQKPAGSHPQARLLATDGICNQLEHKRDRWFADHAKASLAAGLHSTGFIHTSASRALSESDIYANAQASEHFDQLLGHLQVSWRCQKHRTLARKRKQEGCELVWSFADIHRWFSNGGKTKTGHFAEHVSHFLSAQYLEESVGGFRFQLPVEFKPFLQPGELLLTTCREQRAPATIGIVRWVSDNGDGSLVLGASRVEMSARAVALVDHNAEYECDKAARAALLFSSSRSGSHQYLFCAPSVHYTPGIVEIASPHDDEPTRAHIGNTLMSTPFFKVMDAHLLN
ncbi:Hypothetical protein HDN1F_32680 [gamma proteobacterium HdN1]|nr:Hypothetical protein HDN1F_32680 [gamma proteobacterium HdN1]